MKLRHATVLVAVLSAGVACKKSEPAAPPTPVSDVTPSGTPAPAVAPPNPAAQDPWQKTAPKKDPLAHPLFWSIEKDGKTTYILGTMHLGVDAEARLPAIVWTRLDEAKAFAMETDLSDPGLAKDMAERHDGGTVHKDLGDEYWKKLERALTPPVADRLDHMKAMVPATILSMRGLPETPAMDGVLAAHAMNEHKQIVFLEPAAKEAAILEKWMDARALKDMLDDIDGAEKHSQDMLAAYIAGDATKIEALSDEERVEFTKHGRSTQEYEQQMNELLYNRNASWIEPIEKLHGAGGGFIAVGAMHLIGERSVLDLLEHRGYKVTRITP
ncbi:MAG: GumN family protein [Myxococcales bacterium]|nr:GumN family protein [Myxococcales bacterium]